MWIDPSNLTSQWQDSAGTTQVSTPGTVADSSNPVGLALDLRLGATALTDPGNHLFQATSTARPLESARVNLVYDSYVQSTNSWAADSPANISITPNSATAPNGQQVAATLEVLIQSWSSATQNLDSPLVSGVSYTLSYWARVPTGTLEVTGSLGLSATLTSAWQEIIHTGVGSGETRVTLFSLGSSPTPGTKVEFWGAQLTRSDAQTALQSVSDTKTYPSTGFPVYQKYDGTDDGMATASFAAGTLSNDMDCLIAVRRGAAGNAVCGLYESVAEANKVFGIAESGSGSGCVGSGAGTPTVWVDGVQLTGGTAVTRGTLHTALTVGDYHVLEFRGLDLSTWAASGFGLYTSYVLNGALGGILLFPGGNTAGRDAARAWLAAKVGVTLP